ncbi:MAG: RsmB/NOP family class I SAM-dependent RNA methyltransferase [Coriobacteriia bacterium]
MSASPARRVARDVVTRTRERSAFAHETLGAALGRNHLSAADASFATRLAYGTIQTAGTLEEVIGRYIGGKRLEPRILDALSISVYELLFLRTPARAAVSEGVELVREVRPQATGLANAVLRRLAEDAPGFPWGDPEADPAALARLYGHPRWLVDLWLRELGRETTVAVLAANNEPAPLYLAANPFRAPAEATFASLEESGASPSWFALPGCILAENPSAAIAAPALAEGAAIVADASAQLACALAPTRAGAQAVEIGAGRGTKTLLLQANALRRSGGVSSLTAVEVHAFKASLLSQRMHDLGVPSVETLVADATQLAEPADPLPPRSADAVLVDAPCSGLGTLRRHPDKRWRVQPTDLEALAVLGGRMLAEASKLVRPGGFVVYSTCTISHSENADVARAFLASEAGKAFRVDSVADDVPPVLGKFITSEGFYQSVPEQGGPDGHFAVRFARIPED